MIYKLRIERKGRILCLYLAILTISIIVCNKVKILRQSHNYCFLYFTTETVNMTTPLVFVVCPDQIKLIPDFANISNEKKKAEDEKQTDVGVKDRNACGISPWKHCEAVSLSIVLVHHYLESIFLAALVTSSS